MLAPRMWNHLVVLAFIAGCGSKNANKTETLDGGALDAGPAFLAHHSCEWKGAGTCTDFANADKIEDHRKICDGFQGIFAAQTPCSKERLVGTCEIEIDERKRYYQGEGALSFSAQSARENCESAPVKGKFTTP